MATVTHRITTYFKLAKGETGLTQIDTRRLSTLGALNWIIEHAPEDAITVSHIERENRAVIDVYLDKLNGAT